MATQARFGKEGTDGLVKGESIFAQSVILMPLLSAHVDDGGAAVQVLVQVVQNLPQLLHVLFVGLQQHGLEVHRKPVPVHSKNLSFFLHALFIRGVVDIFCSNKVWLIGLIGGDVDVKIKKTWIFFNGSPQDGLHKDTQRFDVDPRDEGFTEVDFEPPHQRTLKRVTTGNGEGPQRVWVGVRARACGQHTNCFFLSVDKRVISSLSAFISSSLY